MIGTWKDSGKSLERAIEKIERQKELCDQRKERQ